MDQENQIPKELTTPTETELLGKLREKDNIAFSLLYNRHVDSVYGYLLRILKSRELAEDITQETFVKLWKHAANIETTSPLKPYLFVIARNQALNLLKKASRETWITDEIFDTAIYDSENGLQYTQRTQTAEYINLAISKLPPKRRNIYDLCRNYGYTYKETAKKLGITDSTVNSQMVKALKFIKNFLIKNGALVLLLYPHK